MSAFGLMRRREPTWACSVSAGAYADGPSRSILLFLMASEARLSRIEILLDLAASLRRVVVSQEPVLIMATSPSGRVG